MPIAGVSQCTRCGGTINQRWSSCPSCLAPLPSRLRIEWERAWRDVARIANGIEEDDPRFIPVTEIIGQMDEAFSDEDWEKFQPFMEQLRVAVRPAQ